MKLSVQNGAGRLTIKLEGRVIGEWTAELQRTWDDLKSSLGPRQVYLDLCDVIYLDENGKRILHEIFAATGAEFLADSPLTKQFVNEITQGTWTGDRGEVNHA